MDENGKNPIVVKRRLEGVNTARPYVIIYYDVPVSQVSVAVAVTSGL